MDNGVQDNIDKIEINEKIGIISPIIRLFDGVGIDINGSNLNADTDIYFAKQAAGDIDQTIKRLKIDISVDNKFTSD